MKLFLLSLLFIMACTSTNFYKTAEVEKELEKNSLQLSSLSHNVHMDFEDKKAFYQKYYRETKDKKAFIITDLGYRLESLKAQRDLILQKSDSIKKINDDLLTRISGSKKIQENSPLFNDIEKFAVITQTEAKELFQDYENYRKASQEFAQFALFTGKIWK